MAKPPTKPDMSDTAVTAKTGKPWAEWFALLDAAGAQQLDHKQIVAILGKQPAVAPWWRQMITVKYEQARGRRAQHQRPDGFQISASRTIAAPNAAVFRAWNDGRARARWLPEAAGLNPMSTTAERRLSFAGPGDSHIEVRLVAKNADRTQVTVQERKLPNATAATQRKAHWSAALDALEGWLGA
ncbi:MAG: hypothetical protein IT317_10285 [Anaerolineales bacterium]|nr:hypothetical protein [Anaerolineales bacterium]